MTLSAALTTHYNALWTCPFHQTVLASTLALGTSLYFLSPLRRTPRPRTIKSPRDDLARLSAADAAKLPYPADLLPGGRWVPTPHGTFRAFEHGPESGRRVLLVHGLSTPCCVFRDLFHALVEAGCRVMTFDLFGRGWSDAPSGVPYDDRLHATQVLYALYSASVDWGRFTLAGYSLGGAVAASFAAYLPQRIEALVLIAPGGILRLSKLALMSRLAITGYLPGALSTYITRRRMDQWAVMAEQNRAEVDPADRSTVIDTPAIIQWQTSSHPGFVVSLASSLKYAPLYDRQQEWKMVGEGGIEKIGVIMGQTDKIIELELLPEMVELLGGAQKVKQQVIPDAGHDLVSKNWKDVAEFVLQVMG